MKKIHILGICGTFMGGIAKLAKSLGYDVSGCDANVYPPMSTQLEALGIRLQEGYDHPEYLNPTPDEIVVGNSMRRGMPVIESLLNRRLPYESGPAWLAKHVLQGRRVIAVAGTHGKTTTSSLIAWILHCAGKNPGFLIGGVPKNFETSAQLGDRDAPFVIEADEYDSAFFDKRSKFVHYSPDILVLNNLEYDHADIFPDLAAIQKQFHHCIRTVPGEGKIILPAGNETLNEVIEQGCWTPCTSFSVSTQSQSAQSVSNADWQAHATNAEASQFVIRHGGESAEVRWSLIGQHNLQNAIAAVAAAYECGVSIAQSAKALNQFQGVRRRLEVRGTPNGITIYDDFAHHPTAIATTLSGLRQKVRNARLIAVLELRSHSMRMGVHHELLGAALAPADEVYIVQSGPLGWDLKSNLQDCASVEIFERVDKCVRRLKIACQPGDHVVIMSNGGFDGFHEKLLTALGEAVKVAS